MWGSWQEVWWLHMAVLSDIYTGSWKGVPSHSHFLKGKSKTAVSLFFARHTFKKRQQKNNNILQRHPPIWVPLRQNRNNLDSYGNLASYRVEQTMTPGHLFISILQLTVLTSQANGERRMRMEGRKRSHLCPWCANYDMSAEAYRCVFQGWCPGRKHLAGGRRREVLL